MNREGKRGRRWKDVPLGRKVLLAVVSIMLLMLVINIILYSQINKTIRRMDTVYSSNVDLTELSDSLSDVQEALYAYLSVKTSDSLENYYKSEQTYRNLLENLGNQISSNPTMLLERNIRKMSESYLALAEEAVSAKRGRNVEKYKELYDSSQNLYSYINTYIDELNSQQFRNNSASYQTLREALEISGNIQSCADDSYDGNRHSDAVWNYQGNDRTSDKSGRNRQSGRTGKL